MCSSLLGICFTLSGSNQTGNCTETSLDRGDIFVSQIDERFEFEIINDERRALFFAWILDVSDEQFNMGIEQLRKDNISFRVLDDLFRDQMPFTAVVEHMYVDRTYRDSYYTYYSAKHFNYSRYCKRVSFFSGTFEASFIDCDETDLEQSFMGTIVIRPISGRSVGRTLLAPKYFLKQKPVRIRLTKYNVTIYGKGLCVRAFPYSMQDGETTSCAEITILNLLDYYSQTYPDYHFMLPSDIERIVEKNSYERRLPTLGLSYELLSKIFCEAGFYPRLYAANKMGKRKFRHIMHKYIESGIPVALGLRYGPSQRHSVVGIGYAMPEPSTLTKCVTSAYNATSRKTLWVCDVADGVSEYCIMDDNQPPYQIVKCGFRNGSNGELCLGEPEVEYMMVPLYKRMILEAADAHDICMSLLADDSFGIMQYLSSNSKLQDICRNCGCKDVLNMGQKENPLTIRVFMASSRTFKRERDRIFRAGNSAAQQIYSQMAFPKFIWVCEISTPELMRNGKAFGEIVIDATASAEAKSNSFIILHYPGAILGRTPENFPLSSHNKFEYVTEWDIFDKFDGNLE